MVEHHGAYVDFYSGYTLFHDQKLERFFFLKSEWKEVGHSRLLRMAESEGFKTLFALEGGFELSETDDYNDARYNIDSYMNNMISSLWSNHMSNFDMWKLRFIFRLSRIATFESEKEVIEYARRKRAIKKPC